MTSSDTTALFKLSRLWLESRNLANWLTVSKRKANEGMLFN